MFAHPESQPAVKTRKQSAEAILRAMTRFPMIVKVLGELEQAEVPCPGDEDIRHGCERALTAMLVELARIDPAPPGKRSESEAMALNWLQGKSVDRLINADQLQRIQQFIERILGPQLHRH
jgi:hypothetical protein